MVKAIGGSPVALGLGEDFSVVRRVLATGRKWSDGSAVKKIGSHTLIPIAVVAASAIDAIAHAVLLAGKTVGCALNTVLWICTYGKIKFSNSLTPSQLLIHAWKTAAFASFLLVGSAVTVGSSSAAFDLAKTLGLTKEVVVGGIRQFWNKMPKGYAPQDLWAKTDYVAREIWKGAGAAATWSWDTLRYQAWDRFAGHRTAQAAFVASVALAYGFATWKLDRGVAGPWNLGAEYAAVPFTASWDVICSGSAYVKGLLGYRDASADTSSGPLPEEDSHSGPLSEQDSRDIFKKKIRAQVAERLAQSRAETRAKSLLVYLPQKFWDVYDWLSGGIVIERNFLDTPANTTQAEKPAAPNDGVSNTSSLASQGPSQGQDTVVSAMQAEKPAAANDGASNTSSPPSQAPSQGQDTPANTTQALTTESPPVGEGDTTPPSPPPKYT